MVLGARAAVTAAAGSSTTSRCAGASACDAELISVWHSLSALLEANSSRAMSTAQATGWLHALCGDQHCLLAPCPQGVCTEPSLYTGLQVLDALKAKGIAIRVASPKLVMEEAPESYKDVSAVVDTCHEAGISKKAVRLRPVAVIKG